MTKTGTALAVGAMLLASVGCAGSAAVRRGDGLDADRLPENVRSDYAVFAQRCSKCHSLARPLDSGIDDDRWWAIYVAKMRRMPASGISPTDAEEILRFLHYYSDEVRRQKQGSSEPTATVARTAPTPEGR